MQQFITRLKLCGQEGLDLDYTGTVINCSNTKLRLACKAIMTPILSPAFGEESAWAIKKSTSASFYLPEAETTLAIDQHWRIRLLWT
jgi:hypothetical protein